MAILRGGKRIGGYDIRIGIPRDRSLDDVAGDSRLQRRMGSNPETTIGRFQSYVNEAEGFARKARFYAEFNFRLFFVLLFSKKDVLLSNDLDTLLPNYLVSILQKKKIIYDSHELFPEIPELVHKPFVKKCWTKLEAWILPKLKNTYTVCNSIADFYDKKYNTR